MFLTTVRLTPHPDTPPAAIGSVVCSVSWQDSGSWCFDYIVGEPPEALRLPATVGPARADGLWQRTCFELFLRRVGEEGYCEFNFSPSGEWAAYRFDSYREGMAELAVAPPRLTSSDRAQFVLAMEAQLIGLGIDPQTALMMAAMDAGAATGPLQQYALNACLDDSAFARPGQWEAAISAVIEEADGTKSYWALRHPPGKPDFHHPDCFALELPAPDGV